MLKPTFLQPYTCESSVTSVSLIDTRSGPHDIKRKPSSNFNDTHRRAKDYFTAERRRQTVSVPASPQGLSLLLINQRARKPSQSQTSRPHCSITESVISDWACGVISFEYQKHLTSSIIKSRRTHFTQVSGMRTVVCTSNFQPLCLHPCCPAFISMVSHFV